jgi:hypothetical protein
LFKRPHEIKADSCGFPKLKARAFAYFYFRARTGFVDRYKDIVVVNELKTYVGHDKFADVEEYLHKTIDIDILWVVEVVAKEVEFGF